MEIDEANRATFGIVADRAPTSPFVVDLIVERTGDFYGGSLVLMRATIPANSMSVPYSVLTLGDLKDEVDGTITVTIDDSGLRYLAWSGRESAVVKVKDDDDAPAPEKVRVNGHLTTTTTDPVTNVVSGAVAIRWDKVEDATDYDIHWGRMKCPSSCSPDGGWTDVPYTFYSEDDDLVTAFLPLEVGYLYRIEVKATVYEVSGWSETVMVWPQTATPPSGTIAGVKLLSYQTDGHYENYRICNPPSGQSGVDPANNSDPYPIPSDVSVDDITGAVNAWPSAVVWRKPNGENIIRASGGAENIVCDRNVYTPRYNQVGFYHADTIARVCMKPTAVACWSHSEERTVASVPRSILVKVAPPSTVAPRWGSTLMLGTLGDCKAIHSIIVHEAGHAFGLEHSQDASVIHANDLGCKPDAFDVAAMMANYQSR